MEVIAQSLAAGCLGYYTSPGHTAGSGSSIDSLGIACDPNPYTSTVRSYGNASGIRPTERLNSTTSAAVIGFSDITHGLVNGDDTISRTLKSTLPQTLERASRRATEMSQIMSPDLCGAGTPVSFLRHMAAGFLLLQRALPFDGERPSIYTLNPLTSSDFGEKLYTSAVRYGSGIGFYRCARGLVSVARRHSGVGRHFYEDVGFTLAGGKSPSLWGVIPVGGCGQALHEFWHILTEEYGEGLEPKMYGGFEQGGIQRGMDAVFQLSANPVHGSSIKSKSSRAATARVLDTPSELASLVAKSEALLDQSKLTMCKAAMVGLSHQDPIHVKLMKFSFDKSVRRGVSSVMASLISEEEGQRSIALAAHDTPEQLYSHTRAIGPTISRLNVRAERVGDVTYRESDFQWVLSYRIRGQRECTTFKGFVGPLFTSCMLSRAMTAFFGYDSNSPMNFSIFPTERPDLNDSDYLNILRSLDKSGLSVSTIKAVLGLQHDSIFDGRYSVADLSLMADVEAEAGYVTAGIMQNVDVRGPALWELIRSESDLVRGNLDARYCLSYHVTAWSLHFLEYYRTRSIVGQSIKLPVYRIYLE